MNLSEWIKNMRLLGYMICGAYQFKIVYITPEVVNRKMLVFEKTIRDCIINDILDACKEDLEKKENNKKPEKMIKEIVKWCMNNEIM